MARQREIVLTTGAGGFIGRAAAEGLSDRYDMIGLDLKPRENPDLAASIEVDLASDESVAGALAVRPGGMDPAHTAANASAEALGYDLEPKEYNVAGQATHYSIGVVPGALYAILRKRVPGLNAGHGTAFGLSLFFCRMRA